MIQPTQPVVCGSVVCGSADESARLGADVPGGEGFGVGVPRFVSDMVNSSSNC
jgi:hypothetical protein